jgi:hypothetical protein
VKLTSAQLCQLKVADSSACATGRPNETRSLAVCHAAGHTAMFVSLAGAPPARGRRAHDLVVSTLAAGLGLHLEPGRDPLESLAARLAGQDLLIVADIEHLQDSGQVLASLLTAAPGIAMVATSRRRMGVGMEWVMQLGGLTVPPPGALGDVLLPDRRLGLGKVSVRRSRGIGTRRTAAGRELYQWGLHPHHADPGSPRLRQRCL